MPVRSELTVGQSALVLAALSDDATSEQISQLDQLLKSRPELVEPVVNLVGQSAWLAWSAMAGNHDGIKMYSPRGPEAVPLTQRGWFSPRPVSKTLHWRIPSLAASIALVAAGVLLGMVGMKAASIGQSLGVSATSDQLAGIAEGDYRARVVEMSACRWSPMISESFVNRGVISKGESVNLLEGLAQLSIDNFGGRSLLDIEGPAGVVLTADGGCSVTHGRVCADVQQLGGTFSLETPSCSVTTTNSRSNLGVVVDGRQVEVHVFAGTASVVVPWGNELGGSLSSDLEAGESLILAPNSEGRLVRTRSLSDAGKFTARTSMRSNRLVVPDAYPKAVQSLDPVIYWRFEGEGSPDEVRNLPDGRYSGRVHGKLTRRRDVQNGFVDFSGGVSQEELSAHIASVGPVAFGGGDFSVELWMKPSHCHHCSLVSFILPQSDVSLKKHGLLIELGGPTAMDFSLVEPGKVRFLHRSPPGELVDAGVCCFSSANYEVRKWQHIVALKAKSQLRLYMNGKLVATNEDNSVATEAFQVVLGQLDDVRYHRRFVGQLDEVAIYPTALDEAVVLEHYNLIKNAETKPLGASRAGEI